MSEYISPRKNGIWKGWGVWDKYAVHRRGFFKRPTVEFHCRQSAFRRTKIISPTNLLWREAVKEHNLRCFRLLPTLTYRKIDRLYDSIASAVLAMAAMQEHIN